MSYQSFQHDMNQYIKNSQDAYICADDQFKKPLPSNEVTPKIDFLKPSANSADIHIYENEHAVVLEGENLCFCYAVQLGEMKNALHINDPALITPRMIRFNFPPNKKTRRVTTLGESTMQVYLLSHFSKRIKQQIKLKTVS